MRGFSTTCRIITCAFILVFISISNKPFAQWREIYKGTNHNNNIKGISFINPSTGFVAFSEFTGFTIDSGRTFTKRYISYSNIDFNGYTNVNLTFGFSPSGIKTFSSDSVLVYGDFGTEPSILFSANQGLSWKLVYHEPYNFNAPVLNEGITDVAFPGNSNIGYAVHHERILKTTNRGQTWFAVLNTPNQQLKKLSFPSLNVGFATGSNNVYKTSNGGASWVSLSPDAASTNPVYDNVFFTTDFNGYITQSFGSKIFNTKDGGATWKQMNDASVIPVGGSDMYFINDSTGFLTAGYAYEVSKTTDSGKTWELCQRNTNYQYLYYGLNTISFLSDNKTGWTGGQGEYLMITTNGAAQTIPKAYFKVDTTNLSATNIVHLINYSRKIYTYKWIVNNQLISTAYNANYNHDKYKSADTIQLIVNNGVIADTAQTIAYFKPAQPPPTYTGWNVKHTNIKDNLTDIRFFGNDGIIIGTKGIYYTKTGATDTIGWKKFEITSAPNDSLLFERVKFTALAFGDKEPLFYACGNDTVNNSAVIVSIDLNTLKCTFVYKGGNGTHLNAMLFIYSQYYFYKGNLLAVGDQGLEVLYNTDEITTTESYLSDKKNLIDVFRRRNYSFSDDVGILSDSIIYIASLDGVLHFTEPLSAKAKAGSNVGSNYTDLVITPGNLQYYVDADFYFIHDSITHVKPANITYNCITTSNLFNGGIVYVGTNSGIYHVIGYQADGPLNGNEAIEYMPTSQHQSINKIWFKQQAAFDTGYAVGNDGILLKTENFGGPDVPYSQINTNGNCLGDGTYFTGLHGSGSSCKWYVDGTFLTDNCGSFTSTINTAGAHEIKYVVSNEYLLADTSVKTIYINPVPAINLTVDVSDTLLCKSESVLIKINNTQPGFTYKLLQEGTDSVFASASSNGGSIYLQTIPVSETGNYYLRVISNNSGCSRNFTKKIHLVVEHTKSLFTADLYNAIPGENINFYNHSQEASTYQWMFNQDASTQTSALANVSNVHYSSAGKKTLTLISSSKNGCIDTLNTNAVSIYNKPVPDDVCFSYTLLNNDASRPYSANRKTTATPDGGFITNGEGDAPIVTSRYGVSASLGNNKGVSYLAKYSTDGVLKWLVYNLSGGNLFSSAVDASGNIYVSGICPSNSYIHFTNGDSARIVSDTTKYNIIGFLLKLTADGKLIWVTTFDGPYGVDPNSYYARGGLGSKMIIKNNNILFTGSFNDHLTYTKNGITKTLVSLSPCSYCEYQNNFLFKIKDDGTLLWYAYFDNGAGNEVYNLSGVGLDKNNNAYVSGYYEDQVIIHSYNSGTLTLHGNIGDSKGYLVQFDINGNLKWSVDLQNADVKTNALVTDDNGNCYLSGSSVNNITILNSNNSQNILNAATYFLMKFSPAGIYTWGVGAQGDYVSGDAALLLQNNNLYTAGYIINNGPHSSTFNFTTTAGNAIPFTLTEAEFFVAQYNTNGALLRITKSGANPGGYLFPVDIILDSNNNFIIGGTVDNANGGTGSYKIFNTTLKAQNANNFLVKTDFNFCNADLVLPVTLISFDGYLNNNKAMLNWKVADEINVDHYNVQRSTDARNFTTIGSVTAVNGKIENSYFFNDDLSGLQINIQALYYRIEVNDKDGKKSYTKIINIPVGNYSINIYPNPNNGKFKLTIFSEIQSSHFTVKIMNISGKILFTKNIDAAINLYQEDYNLNLSSGTYFVEINDGLNKTIKKLVISK